MKYKNLIVFLIGLSLIITGLFLGGINGISAVISRVLNEDVTLFDGSLQNFSFDPTNNKINELDLTLNNAIINVYEDDVEYLQLRLENAPKNVKTVFDEYKLIIKDQRFINIKNEKMIVNIYVPRNFVFNDVSLEVNGGVIEINQLNTKQLDIDLNAGFIKGNDCFVEQEYDIECNAGDIDLISKNSLQDYGYDIDCNIGKVKIGNIHHNGIVEYMSEYKDKMINIDCNVGKVEIRGN